jgi:phage terminase large subunit-like protein
VVDFSEGPPDSFYFDGENRDFLALTRCNDHSLVDIYNMSPESGLS